MPRPRPLRSIEVAARAVVDYVATYGENEETVKRAMRAIGAGAVSFLYWYRGPIGSLKTPPRSHRNRRIRS